MILAAAAKRQSKTADLEEHVTSRGPVGAPGVFRPSGGLTVFVEPGSEVAPEPGPSRRVGGWCWLRGFEKDRAADDAGVWMLLERSAKCRQPAAIRNRVVVEIANITAAGGAK